MKLRNLIAGVCALCGGAVSATAEMVEYWDPVGKVTNSVEAVVVTAGTETLTGGWYVVTGEVSRNRRMNVDGAVNLILADGANLTVVEPEKEYNKGYNPGIRVESGKTLNIYAQSTDANAMGRLSATGEEDGGRAVGRRERWPSTRISRIQRITRMRALKVEALTVSTPSHVGKQGAVLPSLGEAMDNLSARGD